MPSPYLSHKAARRPRRLDTRKGFVFYFSWLDNLSYLSVEERNAVVLAIVDYAHTLQAPTHLSGQAMVAFASFSDDLASDRLKQRPVALLQWCGSRLRNVPVFGSM